MRNGSLINLLMKDADQEPKLGDGVTLVFWSDRNAGTVIESKGNRVVVRRDKAVRVDDNGMSDSQSYTFYPNHLGALYYFSKRKDGKYYEVGYKKGKGTKLVLGRSEYYDYSF